MSHQSQRSGLNRRPHPAASSAPDEKSGDDNEFADRASAATHAETPEADPKTVPETSLKSRYEITEAGREALRESDDGNDMRRTHAIELVTKARERVSEGNAAWQTWTWMLEVLRLAAAPINAEPLTSRQAEVLRYIARRLRDRNEAPTQAEIGEYFLLSSSATVHEVLRRIEAKGYIQRRPHEGRGIELTAIGRAWLARCAA